MNSSNSYNLYFHEGYPQYGTVAYIISKKGAEKLLNNIIPLSSPIDDNIIDNMEKKKII